MKPWPIVQYSAYNVPIQPLKQLENSRTMRQSPYSQSRIVLLLVGVMALGGGSLMAQRNRKPQRALPPKFTGKEFAGTFFDDVAGQLQGPRPTGQPSAVPLAAASKSPSSLSNNPGKEVVGGQSSDGWNQLISGSTIEDMVKNSKLRLDQLVANQNKFAGGYVEVRREFSLQALLFAVIEQFQGEVRWKRSAPVARAAFVRVAANSKVTSAQAFKEAKQRVQDLAELLNGNNLEGTAGSELDWGSVIDRVPLMQLLEWAQQGYINSHSASKESFGQHKEELLRFSQLVAVLGKAAIMKDMPDASDPEYRALGEQLIAQVQQIVEAVESDNPDLARKAAGQVGQTCTKCHDGFR